MNISWKFVRNIIFEIKGTNKKFLQVKLSLGSQFPVFTLRDITQFMMYRYLVEEETLKSDKILSSIIPVSLLSRAQGGEKNISFSVQSASVLLLDIVGFTPWCGSLPANIVMDTLNRIFVELDK
jgi:hypothetical protein